MIFSKRTDLLIGNFPQLKSIDIVIEQSALCLYPQYGDDESYQIQIMPDLSLPSVIRAKTVWGALRGLLKAKYINII